MLPGPSESPQGLGFRVFRKCETLTFDTRVYDPEYQGPPPNQARTLVAEWMHFALFGIIVPTIAKSVHFLGLMNSASKGLCALTIPNQAAGGLRRHSCGLGLGARLEGLG